LPLAGGATFKTEEEAVEYPEAKGHDWVDDHGRTAALDVTGTASYTRHCAMPG
jgi:hypothetical protein